MTKLIPNAGWDDVPQLEATTKALAGPGAPMNSQAQALLDRTELLKTTFQDRGDIGHDLWICGGQSNISGRGLAIDAVHLDPPDNSIWQYGNSGGFANQISLAMEPLSMHDVPSGMGPSLVFAREYLRFIPRNRRILLVPCAHGGTSLCSTTNGFTWKVGDESVPNLFENMISQTKAALAAAGDNSRVAGVLWVQGETDGDNLTSGATYQANFDTLISEVRSRLGIPNLPFIIGQMVPEYLTTGTRAQINAAHIDTPRRNTFTGFSYGAVGKNNGDGNHYNAPGQRLNGKAMFQAYRMALVNVLGPYPSSVPQNASGGYLTLAQSGTSVTATWARPMCRITDYPTQYSTDGGNTWATLVRTQGIDPSSVITGLTPGNTVQVRVAVSNEVGTSAYCPAASLTLQIPVPQITGLTVTATDSRAALVWNAAPSATGGYQVQYRKHGDSTWLTWGNVGGASTTIELGVTGTQYDFQVAGLNAAGVGTYSATESATTGENLSVLLDEISVGAWGAWSSARKLRSAYPGKAFNVRRSSDNTTMDIGFAGNAVDTATLLSFCGSGSGFITKLYDQSGNGRDFAQAAVANQPKIVNLGALQTIGSAARLAALYDGAASYLTQAYSGNAPGLYNQGATTFAGALQGTISVQKFFFAEASITNSLTQYALGRTDNGGGSNLSPFVRSDTTQLVDFANGGPTLLSSPQSTHQFDVVDTGGVITPSVDGVSGMSTNYNRSGQTFTPTNLSVGALVRNTIGNYFGGLIGEMVAFPVALGASDLATLRVNQKAYWPT